MSLKSMSRRSWTLEDVLLYDSWVQRGGLVFAGVAGEGRTAGWPAEPGPRRIGAVRIDTAALGRSEARIVDGPRDGRDDLWRLAAYAGCEVIVAGRRLSRALIGEVLVGAALLRMTAPVGAARPLILCVQPETTLLEACRELGIAVWQPAWANQSILGEAFDGHGLRSTLSAADAERRRVRLEAMLEEYRTLRDPAFDLAALPSVSEQAAGAGTAPRAPQTVPAPKAGQEAQAAVPAGPTAPGGARRPQQTGPRPADAVPLGRWREEAVHGAEEHYLLDRWRRAGGLFYCGVALSTGGPQRRWRRSADGGVVGSVQVPAPEGSGLKSDLVPFSQSRPGELDALLAGGVQVIRAGLALTRGLIGEVVTGAALLSRAYRPASVRPVVLCDEGSPLLEKVCERLSVEVWKA